MNNERELVQAEASALAAGIAFDADELSEEVLEHVSGGVAHRPPLLNDSPVTDVAHRPPQ